MFTSHEVSDKAVHALFTGRPMPVRPAVTVLKAPRTGDSFTFGGDRMTVEIVVGFRPGIDRVSILATAARRGAECLLTTEEAGSAVIIDKQLRRIVLQGVSLAELVPGDIEIGASA